MMNDLAKLLIVTGAIIIFAGLIVLFLNRIPGITRLPGDIVIKRENFTFYFPLMTSVVVSVILSLFFLLFNRR